MYDFMETLPPAPVMRYYFDTRDQVWILNVECPFCGDAHRHGGGGGRNPRLGARKPHCRTLKHYSIVVNENSICGKA